MARLAKYLLLLGVALSVLGAPAFAQCDKNNPFCTVDEEFNNVVDLQGNPVIGTLLLCEGDVAADGKSCVGGNTATSDVVAFEMAFGKPIADMCSDIVGGMDNTADVAGFLDCKVAGALKAVTETSNEGIEKITYVPGVNDPGYLLVNGQVVTYTIYSDTPEPSSILLLGSGLVGLAGVLRRRIGLG